MQETLVVITYIASGAQGNELELAVTGWRKHFKHPHRIVVVGDVPPFPNVEFFPVDKVAEREGEYYPHLDICNKLEHVSMMYADSYDGFIWASDDCFPVNDFTLEDVKLPKYQDEEMPRVGQDHFNPWWRNLVKTRQLCEKEGYGVRNYVTHLPLYFRFSDLIRTLWRYDMTERSFVLENVVYNKYPPKTKPVKLYEGDTWKHTVCFTPLDRDGLHKALARVKFVCVSVNGWCIELEEEIRKHYGIKNRSY